MAMGAIERVVLRWRTNGIGANAGATPATIARLEQQVGTRLPDDVRSFFAAMISPDANVLRIRKRA